jgi:hypothetical protein
MLKAAAKKRRPIMTMLSANLDVWIHSPRTVLMLVFSVALCYMEVTKSLSVLSAEGIILNWAEAPYKMFEYGINFLMSSILVFVMISEIPRRMPYQNYMLIRTDRKRWLTSQVTYSLLLILAVLIMLILCVLIFSLSWTARGEGWSDTTRIAEGMVLESQGVVPRYVREHFIPATAALYALLPVFGFWFTMATVVLLFSFLGASYIGLLICAFALLAQFVGSYPFPYPIRFALVQSMNPDAYGPELYWKAIAVYGTLNLVMIGAMYLRISRADLVFYAENKL